MAGFRPRFFIDDPTSHRLAAFGPEGGDPAVVPDLVVAPDLTGTLFSLSPEDSHHALRVLRLGPGDECEVVVAGAVYGATVVSATMPVATRLDSRLEGPEAGAAYRTAVGLVQSVERLALVDDIVQKGTEVGASFFLLLPRADREIWRRWEGKQTRWQRIAREAAKQSKQVLVPPVTLCPSVEAAFARLEAEGAHSLLLDPHASRMIADAMETWPPRSGSGLWSGVVALWVGPEGGWSQQERHRFVERGVDSARLGRSVLRTETAGPVAVAVARFVLGDW